MPCHRDRRLLLARRRLYRAAVIGTLVAVGSLAVDGAHGASRTYTGGGATNLFSNAVNFGGAVPAAGDDVNFSASPAGDYTLNNDLSARVFGTVNVNRAGATQMTTIQNGLNTTAAQIGQGRLTLDGGTSAFTGNSSTPAKISLLAGSVAGGNGSITLRNGAVVSGVDFLAGGVFGGFSSTGAITVTGGGTAFAPLTPGTTASDFGSRAGSATILIDDSASVAAVNAYLDADGSLTVSNNASLTLTPLNSAGQRSIFSVGGNSGAHSNVTVSAFASVTANASTAGTDSLATFGLGQNSTTVVNLISGGSLIAGVMTFGGAENTPAINATPASSTSTFTVSGAGTLVAAMTSFGANGNALSTNNQYGNVTLNVLDGGTVIAPIVALAAGNRPAGSAVLSTTNVLVSGSNSGIRARTEANNGVLLVGSGTNTNITVNLVNGGLFDADAISLASAAGANVAISVGAGSSIDTVTLRSGHAATGSVANASMTLNLTGGTVDATDLAVIGEGSTTGVADGSSAAINITSGAFTTTSLITSTTRLSNTAITVAGANARLNIAHYFKVGDSAAATNGTGRTILDVSGGGIASLGTIIGGATPNGTSPDAVGTKVSVSGVGSKINVDGSTFGGGANGDLPLPANVVLGASAKNRGELNVLDGGVFTMNADPARTNLNGTLALADATGASGFVTVDGVGATLNAGVSVTVAGGDPALRLSSAAGVITVRNGGVLNTRDIKLATIAGTGNASTLTLGGGTNVSADANSHINASGTVLVGGRDDSAGVAVAGSPSTLTINNGQLDAGGTLVYSGSSIAVNKGVLHASLLKARGGTIALSTTAVAGVARLVADEIRVDNGGVIDIGRSGGVSFVDTASGDNDLAEIRALIVAGLTGGPNSIRSSVVAASTNLAIGYAPRAPGGRASFLGQSFATNDSAVLFRVTLKGDADLSGTVTFSDLVALAQNYNKTGRQWFDGDFNYDGSVGFTDLVQLAQNYNGVLPAIATVASPRDSSFAADWAMAQSFVPEPASVGLLGLAAAGLVRRRR